MPKQDDKIFSRRAFAQRAALLSATAGIAPSGLLLQRDSSAQVSIQLPDNFPKLSAEGQAEADARYQLALSRYGSRLSEEQKKTIKLMCYTAQPGLERLRSFQLKNGDVPDLFLKPIVEREKQPSASPSNPSVATGKKS